MMKKVEPKVFVRTNGFMKPCSAKQIIMITEFIFTVAVFIYLITLINNNFSAIIVALVGGILIYIIVYCMVKG